MVQRATLVLLFLFSIIALCSGPQAAVAVVRPAAADAVPAPQVAETGASIETIQLNWRQRLVLKLAAKKMAKAQRRAARGTTSADPDPVKTHPMAWAALGFLISTLVLLGFLGFIGAIICGSIAQRRINAEPYNWKGYQLAKTCKIIGIVGVALTILLIGLLVAAFAGGL